ncbi:MAG: DUF1778 domain-containing protein [Gemmataceae bacterium]
MPPSHEDSAELQPDASPAPLSARDWETFAAALDNPPPANDALQKAMNRRAKRVRNQKKAQSGDR